MDPPSPSPSLKPSFLKVGKTAPHTVVSPIVEGPTREAGAPRPSPIVAPSLPGAIPDPDAEPKRKRAAPQNLQRLPTIATLPGIGDTDSRHTQPLSNGSRRRNLRVTFESQSLPSRNETPDADAEPKRKRAPSPSPGRIRMQSLSEIGLEKKLKKKRRTLGEDSAPVPAVPPEPPASHLPEPESQITEPPPNLADSPQIHGSTLPVVEQATGKLSDGAEPQPTVAKTPDMTGSNGAVPHCFETDETQPILPEPTGLDASASTESAGNSQAALSDALGSQPELSPLPTLPQDHANLFPRGVLDEVLDLTDQVASTALFGPIGVGKSSVALTLLHHNRTKAKYGGHRYLMHCDNVTNSLEGFLKCLCDTIHTNHATNMTQIRLHLESSPPFILLLDGVDCILDPLAPEAEDISSAIEEFGSCDRVCLLTTSRMDPEIPGFHRVEVPILSEGDARDAFYSLCNVERSPAVDDLIARMDFHPLSIDFLASSVRENGWDEPTLLKAWDDDKVDALKTEYHQRLRDAMGPLICSPTIQNLGTVAPKVLGAIAAFPRGIEERRLQRAFAGATGVEGALNVLCKFSLIYRQDGLVKVLSPFQFYFLESMLEPAQHVEVIRCNADNCNAAKAWLPVYTNGPPQMTAPHSTSLEDWIKILRSVKRSEQQFQLFVVNPINPIIELLALFDRPPVPINLGSKQEDRTTMPSAPLTGQISSAPVAYEIG